MNSIWCRKDVHCFGEQRCYPLAFAVPGLLMAIGTIVIICGQRTYVMRRPQGNVLLPVVTSIAVSMLLLMLNALRTQFRFFL